MWLTFAALVKEADFAAAPSVPKAQETPGIERNTANNAETEVAAKLDSTRQGISLGGLIYNIEIHLPESRDKAVYDVLFRSLREHLL